MKTTRTTSSRCITEISDFPMPAGYPAFPTHSQIKAYLEAYCARFSLTGHIRFNQRVTRISKRGAARTRAGRCMGARPRDCAPP